MKMKYKKKYDNVQSGSSASQIKSKINVFNVEIIELIKDFEIRIISFEFCS